MNERIRELLEQAEKHVYEMWVKEGTPLYPESHDLFIQQKDKTFAELIVKECVAICQDIDGEDNIDARSGRQDCAVEIKEHFGVE